MKWQLPEDLRWRKGSVDYFAMFHFIATAALWVFVIAHAANMDITHDEAYSFRLIKTNHFRAMAGTANTHWLNSFFMKLFSLVFGDAPFALRLHSVSAFPFFAYAVFRLSMLLKSRFIQLAFYCVVLFNPYFLDFFSLARGYGLAFTFQAWLLVVLAKISQQNYFDSRQWFKALLLCTLMVGSNLSYLYSISGAGALLVLYLVFFPETGYRWANSKLRMVFCGFVLLGLLTCADLMTIKYIGKDLNYGPHHDPVGSVIGSVVQGSFYFFESPVLSTIITYVLAVLLLIFSISVVALCIRQRTVTRSLATGLVLISTLVLTCLLLYVNDIALLVNRTALQWYTPGVLLICCAIDERALLRKVAAPVSIGIALVMIFHFVRQCSIYRSLEWQANQGGRAIFSNLQQLHGSRLLVSNALGGVYNNYYTLVNSDLLHSSVIILSGTDQQSLTDSLLKKGDYIACPRGWEKVISDAGQSFTIERFYPHSQYELIRVK